MQPAFNPGYGAPSTVSPEVQKWFSAVDKDRSGHISATELQGALVNAQGKNFSETACRLMIGNNIYIVYIVILMFKNICMYLILRLYIVI